MTAIMAPRLGLELRQQADGTLLFAGYATAFDVWYDVGSFEEVFRPGSFRRTLNEDPDVVLLVNHEGLSLARTKSGTLSLSEDPHGLRVEARLDSGDPQVRMLKPRVERADVTEMSLAFSVLGETGQAWSEDFNKREILAANINRGDVSVVTMGANDATSVAFRGVLTLEQRRRCAQELGSRITGRRSLTHSTRASASECARCEGRGEISLPCPNCAGSSGVDGVEEPPPVSSSVDRGFDLMDLDAARREVNDARDGESRKAWELEVREVHHEMEVGRVLGMAEFRERTRRQLARQKRVIEWTST